MASMAIPRTASATAGRRPAGVLLAVALACGACVAHAAVLPEERADAMYKRYQGGGLTVDGPAVLVRKNFADKVSVTAGYDVDQVSGASIDMVVLGASPLREERKQKDLGVSYMRGKITYAVNVSNSLENDYNANTANLSISQDMFGDLTTVTLSAGRGWDTITRVTGGSARVRDPNFRERLARDTYGLAVSQILTRNLIGGLNYETITEQGYLQNPYRAIRFLSPDGSTFLTGPETYPKTRTGNAVALRLKYYLPWRASVGGSYRYYFDTWDIRAHTAELGYTHPFLADTLTADVKFRYYKQTAASFYSDLFPRADFQNFQARDKELAASDNSSLGVSVTYDFMRAQRWFIKKGSASLDVDYIMYRYDDFRDASVRGVAPGSEPLYKYNATAIRAFVSIWF